jgi:hypothetical protein
MLTTIVTVLAVCAALYLIAIYFILPPAATLSDDKTRVRIQDQRASPLVTISPASPATAFNITFLLRVNSWNAQSSRIVWYAPNAKTSGTADYSLYFHPTDSAPTLCFAYSTTSKKLRVSKRSKPNVSNVVALNPNPDDNATTNASSLIVVKNFPLQRWVHVGIIFRTSAIDFYVDGKMVATTQGRDFAGTQPAAFVFSTESITTEGPSGSGSGSGDTLLDAEISHFERTTRDGPYTPTTLYAKYQRFAPLLTGQQTKSWTQNPYSVRVKIEDSGSGSKGSKGGSRTLTLL